MSIVLLTTKLRLERKKRNLSLPLLAKQVRLRQELLTEIESLQAGDKLNPAQYRALLLVADFLQVKADPEELKQLCQEPRAMLPAPQPEIKPDKNFTLFTSTNINLVAISAIVVVVVSLVAMPAYLVLRPALLEWTGGVDGSKVIFDSQEQQLISGATYRARSLVFGGESISLQEGRFQLLLPAPDRKQVVQIILTNYFNLETTYYLILTPPNSDL